MTNARLRQWLERLDLHIPGEAAHGERVAVFAVATAQRMGWPDYELAPLRFATALHDVGKLALPSELLLKREAPTGADVLEFRKHAASGAEMLVKELGVEPAEWIAAHHERWDGNGYPHLLLADQIPLGARVIAVAETFDVLLNDARWRNPLTEAAALDEVRRCAGTQFDSEVVEAFLAVQPLIQPVA